MLAVIFIGTDSLINLVTLNVGLIWSYMSLFLPWAWHISPMEKKMLDTTTFCKKIMIHFVESHISIYTLVKQLNMLWFHTTMKYRIKFVSHSLILNGIWDISSLTTGIQKWMKQTNNLVYTELYFNTKQHSSKLMFLHQDFSSLRVQGIDVINQRFWGDLHGLNIHLQPFLPFLWCFIGGDQALLLWHAPTIHWHPGHMAHPSLSSKLQNLMVGWDARNTLTQNLLVIASFPHLILAFKAEDRQQWQGSTDWTTKTKQYHDTYWFYYKHYWSQKNSKIWVVA